MAVERVITLTGDEMEVAMMNSHKGKPRVYTQAEIDALDPATFGVGSLFRDDGVEYWSDGFSFIRGDGSLSQHGSKILFSSLGDSTLSLGNSGGSCQVVSTGITASVTINNHNLNIGMEVVIAQHPNPVINGSWKVESIVSPSVFTYVLNEPLTSATASAVLVIQQVLKAKDHLTLSSIISGGKGVYNGAFAVGASLSSELDSQIDLLLEVKNNLYNRISDIVFISTGINDAINDTLATTTQSNLEAAVIRLKASGIRVVVFTQFPLETTYSAWTVDRLAESRKYNQWLIDNQLRLGITLIDVHSLCSDKDTPNGDWKGSYSNDGIHPNRISATAVADEIVAKVWSAASAGEDRDLTNVLPNTTLSGIGGVASGVGVSGDLADDFNTFAGGGGGQLITLSKGVSLVSGVINSQRIQLQALAALDFVTMSKNATSDTSAGHWYVAKVVIHVASSSVNIRDLNVTVLTNPNGVNKSVGVLNAFENGSLTVAGKTLTIETPPVQRQVGVTQFSPQIRLRMGGIGTAIIDVHEFSLIDVTASVDVPNLTPQVRHYPRNPITSIDAETWEFTTGAGTSASLVPDHAKKQTNTLRVSTPAVSGVNAYGQANLVVPMDLSHEDFIELKVFSEGVDTLSPTWGTLFLFSSNYSSTANYYWANVVLLKSGWNIIKIRKSAFNNSAGDWANIQWVRFRVNSSLNSVRTCFLSRISAVKTGDKRATVSLGFDDGNASQVEAAQLAADRGLKATFYIIRRLVGAVPNFMDESQLAEIAAMGHELAVHGTASGHDNWREQFNAEGATAFTASIASDIAYFKTLPGFNTELASWPQGRFSQVTDVPDVENGMMSALKAAGVNYCRATKIIGSVGSTNHAQYDPDYPRSGLLISGGLSLRGSNSVVAIKNLIDDAIENGAWVHIYGHKLSTTGTDGITYLTNEYIEVLDYLALKRDQGVLDTSTFGEAVKHLVNTGAITNSVED